MQIKENIYLQKKYSENILLIKEGSFYVAYNEGAFLLREYGHKVKVNYIESIDDFILSVSFSQSIFLDIKMNHSVTKKDYFLVVSLLDVQEMDFESYDSWKLRFIYWALSRKV